MGRAVARCGRSALGVGLLLLLLPPPVAGDQLRKAEYKDVVAMLEKADQGQPIKVGQSFFYPLSPALKAAWAGDTETWYFVGGTLEAPKVVRDQVIPQLSGAPSTLKMNSLLMLQRKDWSLTWSEADVVKAGDHSKGYGNLIDPRTLKLVPPDFYRTVYFETLSGKLELTAEPESCEEVYPKAPTLCESSVRCGACDGSRRKRQCGTNTYAADESDACGSARRFLAKKSAPVSPRPTHVRGGRDDGGLSRSV